MSYRMDGIRDGAASSGNGKVPAAKEERWLEGTQKKGPEAERRGSRNSGPARETSLRQRERDLREMERLVGVG